VRLLVFRHSVLLIEGWTLLLGCVAFAGLLVVARYMASNNLDKQLSLGGVLWHQSCAIAHALAVTGKSPTLKRALEPDTAHTRCIALVNVRLALCAALWESA
jgi:hypothetical protein